MGPPQRDALPADPKYDWVRAVPIVATNVRHTQSWAAHTGKWQLRTVFDVDNAAEALAPFFDDDIGALTYDLDATTYAPAQPPTNMCVCVQER